MSVRRTRKAIYKDSATAAILILSAFPLVALALPTLVVEGGQLIGAVDVNVEGTLYEVTFVDGTCIDLFDGCDQIGDFTFQDEAAAVAATQALIDQVLLDTPQGAFDSRPELTGGCTVDIACLAMVPYALPGLPGDLWVSVAWAINNDGDVVDFPSSPAAFLRALDSEEATSQVWSLWTRSTVATVPLPGALPLLTFALAWIGLFRGHERT